MDATRISVARLVELGVGVSWREAGAVAFEAIAFARKAGGTGEVADPAESCLLTRGGKIEFAEDAVHAAPEAVLTLLDRLLTSCADPDRLGKAHAAGHTLTFLAQLGELTSPQRRRVEIASLALRGLAAEVDHLRATGRPVAPLSSSRRTPPPRPAPIATHTPVARPDPAEPTPAPDRAPRPAPTAMPRPSASPPAASPMSAARPIRAERREAGARLETTPRNQAPVAPGPATTFEPPAGVTGRAEPIRAARDWQRPWPRAVPPSPPSWPEPDVPLSPVPPAPSATRTSRRSHHEPLDRLTIAGDILPLHSAGSNGLERSLRLWAGLVIVLAMAAVAGAWWWVLAPTSRATPPPTAPPAVTAPVTEPPATREPLATANRPPPADAKAPTGAFSDTSPTTVPDTPGIGESTAPTPSTPAPRSVPLLAPQATAGTRVAPVEPGAQPVEPAVDPVERDDAIFSSTSSEVQPPVPLSPLPSGTSILLLEESTSGPFFEVLVDRNGLVEEVKLRGDAAERSERYQAVMAAARRWRFLPAQLNGNAVRYALRVTVTR